MIGLPVIGRYVMNNFKADVISMEHLIGGDLGILEKLEEKQETYFSLLTNRKKSKKKEVETFLA